jgi:hypothetical protein
METSKTSTGDESNPLTSFAEAIHASLSAQQANDEAKKIQDTFGHGLEKPLASYDPDTQSWKMYGDTSLWGEPQSLEKLPPSGMTVNGVLYQQPVWVPITDVIESSSWPTPTTQDHIVRKSTQQKPGSMHSVSLGDAVRMWPTPRAQSMCGGSGAASQIEAQYLAGNINDEERKAMRAGNGGQLNPTWVEWLMGFPTGWTDLEA